MAARVTLWLALSWVSLPPLAVLYLTVLWPAAHGRWPAANFGYVVVAAMYCGILATGACAVLYPVLCALALVSPLMRGAETTRTGVLATCLPLAAGAVVAAASVVAPNATLVADLAPWTAVAWACLAWPRLALPALQPGALARAAA